MLDGQICLSFCKAKHFVSGHSSSRTRVESVFAGFSRNSISKFWMRGKWSAIQNSQFGFRLSSAETPTEMHATQATWSTTFPRSSVTTNNIQWTGPSTRVITLFLLLLIHKKKNESLLYSFDFHEGRSKNGQETWVGMKNILYIRHKMDLLSVFRRVD